MAAYFIRFVLACVWWTVQNDTGIKMHGTIVKNISLNFGSSVVTIYTAMFNIKSLHFAHISISKLFSFT